MIYQTVLSYERAIKNAAADCEAFWEENNLNPPVSEKFAYLEGSVKSYMASIKCSFVKEAYEQALININKE